VRPGAVAEVLPRLVLEALLGFPVLGAAGRQFDRDRGACAAEGPVEILAVSLVCACEGGGDEEGFVDADIDERLGKSVFKREPWRDFAVQTYLVWAGQHEGLGGLELARRQPQRILTRKVNGVRNLSIQRQRIRQEVDILPHTDVRRTDILRNLGAERRSHHARNLVRSHVVFGIGGRVDDIAVVGACVVVCCWRIVVVVDVCLCGFLVLESHCRLEPDSFFSRGRGELGKTDRYCEGR
jgi:hypothetical protein